MFHPKYHRFKNRVGLSPKTSRSRNNLKRKKLQDWSRRGLFLRVRMKNQRLIRKLISQQEQLRLMGVVVKTTANTITSCPKTTSIPKN
jgi:hypothetical protein